MTTRAHVGLSHLDDSATAGREAATAALSKLPGHRADVALMFATADHQHDALLGAVQAAMPGVTVLGCSGEGVIAHDESVEVFSAVAIMAIASDRIRFDAFLVEQYGTDPRGAGRALGRLVNERRNDARCLCLMPDGLLGNCTDFLDALHDTIGASLPVVGGTSADAMTFDRTYQYANGKVVSGGVAALLISGDADIELAVSHGCTPVGLERTVTKAEGGWVKEIDGQPAWSLFKEYLDGDDPDLNADGIVHLCLGRPLPLSQTQQYDPFIIRTPLQVDHPTGALFFPGGGLQEGHVIQLTRRDPDRIRQSAQECAARVLATHHGRIPDLVLQFDCAGRGRILFGACAAAEIVAPLRQVLGSATPWIGFHTYGEIAPIDGQPYFHNYSVALCAVYERDAA